MKKIERLELENKVLKNMIENILCAIDRDIEIKQDPNYTLGYVRATAESFAGRMSYAEAFGYIEYGPTKNDPTA